jgi:hypothetical protein
MATPKLTEPKERCPICGKRLVMSSIYDFWLCDRENHSFIGPHSDYEGRKVDRMIRDMKRRIVKEASA